MIDRKLPPAPTAVFFVLGLLALGLYIFDIHKLLPPVPSQIFTLDNDTVWVLMDGEIIPILQSKEDAAVDTISLAKHGIYRHVGPVLRLKSGEWIVNSEGQEMTFYQSLRRYARGTEPTAAEKYQGLLKCDSELAVCRIWSDEELVFEIAWNGIERNDGSLIIADTARHVVHLVSQHGTTLDTVDGFRFPNQVVAHNGTYWVVDTNHNKLSGLHVVDEQLKYRQEFIRLGDFDGIAEEHQFPSRAALVNGTWWIMSNDIDMANAGIYKLDLVSKTAFRVATEIDDPVDMVLQEDRMLISSYRTADIWSIDTESNIASKIRPVKLASAFMNAEEEHRKATRQSYLQIAFVALLAAVALIYAVIRSNPVSLEETFSQGGKDRIVLDNVGRSGEARSDEIYWISSNPRYEKRRKLLNRFVPAFLVVLISGLVVYLWLGSGDLHEIDNFPLFLSVSALSVIAILGVFYIFVRSTRADQSKLGVSNQKIVYVDSNNIQTVVAADEVMYSSNALFLANSQVTFQRDQDTMFDKSDFESHLVPLLIPENKLSALAFYFHRLHNKDKVAWYDTGFIVLALLVLIIKDRV